MKSCFGSFFRTARDARDGNVAISFGLMWFVMFGSIFVAVDTGRSLQVETQLQNALDAAAIAALKTGTTNRASVGQQVYAVNMQGVKGASYTDATFETMGNGAVKATATATVPTIAATLMQTPDVTIPGLSIADPKVLATDGSATTSTTTTTTTGNALGPCLHIMDQSGSDALYGDSNSNLHADNCNVYIRTNSSEAMYDISSADVRFRNIKVKGSGVKEVAGAFKVVGAPFAIELNQPVVADPYEPAIRSVIQMISVSACNASNTGKTYTGGTVSPGTYCGATTFNGVKFNPGLYVIASAGGASTGALTMKGKLDGSAGVSFYFADNKAKLASYTAAEQSVLTAPATGLTRGLLFFESSNRGSTWTLTIANVNKQSWTGLIYFPSLNLTLNSLSEWQKWNLSLECNRLTMISLSSVWEPFPWTPYNASQPVTYDASAFGGTTTTTSSVDNPIWLSK